MAFLLLLVNSLLHNKAWADSTEPRSQSYLALSNQHGAPTTEAQTSFDCTDKIFVVAELTHFKRGKHQLSVRWVDPADQVRETTDYPFFVQQDKTRIWAWLSLSRGAGAGILQWLDPAAGLEEFVGPWRVTLAVDGKRLHENEFEVDC